MNDLMESLWFLYGTAWKEERTRGLTAQALSAGFVGIDTANQRKHYFEEAVGAGIQDFFQKSGKCRDDLFIQTKFTYRAGQDHRLPYDISADFATQVNQSFESSLQHLQTNYIDSYILHGPSRPDRLALEDMQVWRTMEKLVKEKKVLALGVSNMTLNHLQTLWAESDIKPCFVQNRCFAITQWDREVREFCKEHDIIYQGFSLLTANSEYFGNPRLVEMAKRYRRGIAQIIFRFSQQIGMLPITGTTDEAHMREDLAVRGFELCEEDLGLIENIAI